MPHYDPSRHRRYRPSTDEVADHPPTAENVVLPWHVADTAPQPVVNPDSGPPTKNLEGLVSHRGQPKRRFPISSWQFLTWLTAGVILVAWLVIVYKLGTRASHATPVPTRTVTETPAARPGPRVTVRVPAAPRVVTRTEKSTVRTTVTRRVPGPTVTVTSPAPLSTGATPPA